MQAMTRGVGAASLCVCLVMAVTLGPLGSAHADAPADARVAQARAHAAARAGDREAQLALVIVLVEEGRTQVALEELDVLEAIAPAEPRAAYWRARALVDAGRSQEAEDALRDTLSARGLGLRAALREERGAYSTALEDYRAAAAIAPTIPLDLRVAHLLERLGQLHEASLALEAGVQRTGSAALRIEAAHLAARAGDYARALAHTDILLASGPSVRWLVLRASILHDAGRESEARATLRRARAQADARVERRGSALALSERARVLQALGDVEGARRDLLRASRQAPGWVRARQQLAQLEASR